MEQQKKTVDRKQYQREYMKARYAKNTEIGAQISKINYYKRLGFLSKEETQQYGEIKSPLIAKAKKALENLKKQDKEFLKDFLLNYLEKIDENI
jgi:hypothetical protein